MTEPLLSIRDLCVDYVTPAGPVRAVDRVSLDVARGEVVGVAGESGCGKSTMAQALLRILPPPAVITGGEVRFEGKDLLRLSEPELREVRWRRIAMVFQSAMDALNPVLTVGEQLVDTLKAHGGSWSVHPERFDSAQDTLRAHAAGPKSREARDRAASLLELVGIAPDRLRSFPHQLSGGMRQRVGIAIALALEPALVILDEPTTALDVIVEREILQQILELRRRLGFSVLFITHDLARMLEISDRVAVFYAARLVEVAPAATLRTAARHPYARGLLRAFPTLRGDAVPEVIPGAPPSLRAPPSGCRFHPRCADAVPACRESAPALEVVGPGHAVACRLR
jgi:peptide/nickel transport system ATP-binding protein